MTETVVVQPSNQDNSAFGMVLALIVILALVIGGVYLYRKGGTPGAPAAPGTNINVTLPAGGGSGAAAQ